MKITDINEFWPAQKKAYNSGPAPFLFMGGVGSGKSFIFILKMLKLLDMYPGSRGAIIRQRSTQLKKTVAATLWKLLDMRYVERRNDNEGFIKLHNGSELHLRHLDKEGSIEDLKSFEINFAMIDQAEDISAEAFDVLCERVGRWSGALKRGGYPADWPYVTKLGERIPPPYVMLTAYSPGYEHWITSRFWDQGDERERYRLEGYDHVIGSTRDNKALTDQYIKGRLAMGKDYVARYVDAEVWGANEGRIFDISDQSLLDYDNDFIRKMYATMRLHRVLDHGEFSPSAVLWYATDALQNVFFFREYMKEGKLVADHRRTIFEWSKDDSPGGDLPPKYYSQYADPQIFATSRGRGVNQAPTWSVADEWNEKHLVEKETAIAWRPASNDEAMTISRVREYLREDPFHRNPITGKMGAPRAYFIKRSLDYPRGCHEVITDLRAAKRIEVGMNADGTKQYGDERDDTTRDHLLDDVRYALGMRPSPSKMKPPVEVKDGHISIVEYNKATANAQMQAEIDRIKEGGASGDYGY